MVQREFAGVQQRPQDVAVALRRVALVFFARRRRCGSISSAVGRRDSTVRYSCSTTSAWRLAAAGDAWRQAGVVELRRVHQAQHLRDAGLVLGRVGPVLDAEEGDERVPRRSPALPCRPCPCVRARPCRWRGPATCGQRVEQSARRRQRLDRHAANSSGAASRLLPAGRLRALVGLAVADGAVQVLHVEAVGGELASPGPRAVRGASGLPSCMSSTGLTKPRPKSWPQMRLTIAWAKNGFFGAGHPVGQTGGAARSALTSGLLAAEELRRQDLGRLRQARLLALRGGCDSPT